MDHTGARRRHTDSSCQEMDHTGASRRHKATQALVAGVVSGDQALVLAALAQGADTSVTVVHPLNQESLCMLSVAAMRGHTHLVPHLLAAGLPVEGSETTSITPLHWAASCGHDQVVRQLLSAQAHLQARGLDGATALHMTAQFGQESCVVTLLGAGADSDSRDDYGRSPLHYAAIGNHTDVVQVLLTAAGCDRHAVDKRGETALYEAARVGGLEATQCLVVAGLDPRARNMEGDTPLDVARLAGRDRVEWWLRKLPRPYPAAGTPTLLLVRKCWRRCEGEYAALLQRIREGNTSGLLGNIRLVSDGHQQDHTGRTLLHSAAELGLARMVVVLLKVCRVYPHVLTWAGETPADLAQRAGHLQVINILHSYHRSKVEGGPGEVYEQLLGVISLCDDTEQAGQLLWSGASLEPQGCWSVSPLCLAVTSNRCRITSLLLAAGAPLTTTSHGLNLLTLAWCSPDVTLRLQVTITRSIYNKERNKLQDLREKIKHPIDKHLVQEILDVQKILFTTYLKKTTRAKKTAGARGSRVWSTGPKALLVASRSGLQQLIFLLVNVGGLAVDTLVDPTAATTALHQAAAHGKSGCVLLLLSLGAQLLRPDRYGHTPSHLAAMFGHEDVYELLAEFIIEPEPTCRAGTTPQEVRRHFSQYLLKYNIRESESSSNTVHINNDPTEAAMNLLRRIDLGSLVRDLEKTTVDFTMCEAQEVKDEVMKELQQITENVSDETFRGKLRLSGSAADGTRLYCPDEFDVNFVLQELPGVKVKIIQQTEKEVLASGHNLKVKIKTKNSSLHGNNLVIKFYDRVRECLKSHTIGDERLSLVPPGLTRTQVGVALSLAWQGSEYPLLLVSVDLVPVVVAPWPEEISRPPLTPETSQIIQLSNKEDGSWRCSLAATEVEVLQQLEPQERRVFLTCKTLLSRMKAEPWMPRHVKNQFSWWDSRYWKVPTPAGFCLKNSFLGLLQRKRETGMEWQEKDILTIVRSVFRDMCHEMVDPSTSVESLVPAKVNAYFGGDCEKPKMGEGAPDIVGYLDTLSEIAGKPKTGYLGLTWGFLNN